MNFGFYENFLFYYFELLSRNLTINNEFILFEFIVVQKKNNKFII